MQLLNTSNSNRKTKFGSFSATFYRLISNRISLTRHGDHHTMEKNVPRAAQLFYVYICVGLVAQSVIATTETSETSSKLSDKTLNLEKRDVDNYELYSDLDKTENDEVSDIGGDLGDNDNSYDFDNLESTYSDLENNSEFSEGDSDPDVYDDDTKEKRYRYYGFEGQLGKRGPMGFMSQLGKRDFGYFNGLSPEEFIDQPGRRRPMGFFSQLGKRGGPMGFYSQLGKRAPMGFMSQLGKRSPKGFFSQLGKRAPRGFLAQLGKRGPMGFYSQLGKRAPMGFMSQLGKRSPMGFFSQLGKRALPMAFYSQLGKRAPFGFLSQLGKRGGPMGFMSQLGKRTTDNEDTLTSELDEMSSQPLSRRKRSTGAIPWEMIRRRLALNRYIRPYSRLGFRGRMGKRYPSFRFFSSQLG